MVPRRNGLALAALLLRVVTASPYMRPSVTRTGNEGTKGSPEFWYHLTISVILVLVGGLFAGWAICSSSPFQSLLNPDPSPPSLTLGLMGLDELHLRVLATSSENPREKQDAQKGFPRLLVNPFAWQRALIDYLYSLKLVATRSALGTCCECPTVVVHLMSLINIKNPLMGK